MIATKAIGMAKAGNRAQNKAISTALLNRRAIVFDFAR
jgi:hypothetical protein